jgi:hypothetical protein
MALQGPADDFNEDQDKYHKGDQEPPPPDIFFHNGKQFFDKIFSNLKAQGFLIVRREKRSQGKKYTLEYTMAGASGHNRIAAGEVLKITIGRDCIVTLSHDICMHKKQGDTALAKFPDRQHTELKASLAPKDRKIFANLCEALIAQIARFHNRPEIHIRHIILTDNPLKDILNAANKKQKPSAP